MSQAQRYPLIYQNIKLTLSYYERLTELNQDKLVFAALQEQKAMKLPWYKNIELLMKIDEIFEQDHVTAYFSKKHPNPNSVSPDNPTNKTLNNRSMPFIKNLSKLKPI